MTTLHYWSIVAALISATTPWFVVRVALAVARNHARAVDAPFPAPPGGSRLGALTIVAGVAASAAAFLIPPPSIVVAAIDGLCFVGLATLGLRALGEIHEASRPAREMAVATRTASLRPRPTERLRTGPMAAPAADDYVGRTGAPRLASRLARTGPLRVG